MFWFEKIGRRELKLSAIFNKIVLKTIKFQIILTLFKIFIVIWYFRIILVIFRPLGRPRKRWENQVKSDVDKMKPWYFLVIFDKGQFDKRKLKTNMFTVRSNSHILKRRRLFLYLITFQILSMITRKYRIPHKFT